MKTPRPDVDSLIEALREDLPDAEQEARVRARLLAAGVVVAGVALHSSAAAGTASVAGAAGGGALGGAGGVSTAPLAAAQVGLWSKVVALPLAAKVGVATVAIGVAASGVPALRALQPAPSERAVASAPRTNPPVARVARATSEPTPAAPVALPAELDIAPAKPAPGASAPSAALPNAAVPSAAVPNAAVPNAAVPSAAVPRRVVAPHSSLAKAEPPREARAPKQVAAIAVPAPPASTLAEEAGLMELAIGALQQGDPERARYWLDEHAARFPDGLLAPDRQRAFARVARASH
jgi:hypothetical protein